MLFIENVLPYCTELNYYVHPEFKTLMCFKTNLYVLILGYVFTQGYKIHMIRQVRQRTAVL